MKILEVIKDNTLYNFHTHTQFCDGHADMADFMAEAAKQGFVNIGFTPHSPIPFESPCNMSMDSVPLYFDEIDRLRKEYPRISIFAGMEIDYINDDWGPASQYFTELGLDFKIGSVHFIPNQEGKFIDIDGRFESFKHKVVADFQGDLRYIVDTFFEHSMAMIEKGHFDIIGHFDKIKHNGSLYMPELENTPWYKKNINLLIDAIIDSGVIVEINTKAWQQHQQLFPAQSHWHRLLKANVPIIVNSDAHYPKLLNASRREVINSLNYLKQKL